MERFIRTIARFALGDRLDCVLNLRRFAIGGAIILCAAVGTRGLIAQTVLPSEREWTLRIDALIDEAIRDGQLPGCVIGAGTSQGTFWKKAYGNRQVEPQVKPMELDTVFDLASLTKPVVTATSIVQLKERGEIDLDAPVAAYLSEFGAEGKGEITVRQLLTHTSGLIPDNPLDDYLHGSYEAWNRICRLRPQSPPGTTFKYSDVNFIVLGKLVEHRSELPLDQYFAERIAIHAGMVDSRFNPTVDMIERCAPTEQRDGGWIRGQVHDPRAFALSGVAGHAGLFSTLEDLSRYASYLLRRKRGVPLGAEEIEWMSPSGVEIMTTPHSVPNGIRSLGWDMCSAFSSNRGTRFGSRAFGHGGFTGTALWIDPDRDLYFVFLSNRLHPDGKGAVNELAGKIANILADHVTILRDGPPSISKTLTGIDVLAASGCEPLRHRRVGLISNHTGIASDGRSTAEVLRSAPDVSLVALFSPEHGYTGKLDEPKIADGLDRESGLTIYSLYGAKRRPTKEMLQGIDVLVFDIQDVGARFYTYMSTMAEAMAAAAESQIPFVVLDRPNPINGITVSGPMLDAGKESFVGCHMLPVRHGMTAGELAYMFRAEKQLAVDLTVIRCQGWERGDYYDQTGLQWISPSPNMRSLRQAVLYPGIGFLETTNLSVGRGTDTPFECVGAPWVDASAWRSRLAEHALPGVVFVPIHFTPRSHKYVGQRCQGLEIIVTNRDVFDSVGTGVVLAQTLRELHPDPWKTESLEELLGNQAVIDGIRDGTLSGRSDDRLYLGIREFLIRRQKYLLYP